MNLKDVMHLHTAAAFHLRALRSPAVSVPDKKIHTTSLKAVRFLLGLNERTIKNVSSNLDGSTWAVDLAGGNVGIGNSPFNAYEDAALPAGVASLSAVR
jgi:hypothetical protein